MKGIRRVPSLQQPAGVLCPLSMSLESAACAIAARAEGYGGLADIIAEQKLAPGAIGLAAPMIGVFGYSQQTGRRLPAAHPKQARWAIC
jgi:hypothetical protein